MAKVIGAYIDGKTGHEVQQLDNNGTIDLDDLLNSLGVKHDERDMWSQQRSALREALARDPGQSPGALKTYLDAHKQRHDTRAASLLESQAHAEACRLAEAGETHE